MALNLSWVVIAWRHFRSKYGLEECNVMKSYDESVRMSVNLSEYVNR